MSDEDLPRYDSDSDGGWSVVTGAKRVKKSLVFPVAAQVPPSRPLSPVVESGEGVRGMEDAGDAGPPVGPFRSFRF